MAKSKPQKATKTEQRELPKATLSGGKYKRLSVVGGSQIKTQDNVPVHVKILQPIDVQAKRDKDGKLKQDEDGSPASISILKVVDLDTGEVGTMIAGKALVSRLQEHGGGNDQYVGLCFEITKMAKQDGKRWKDYRVFEIEAPGEGKVK